MAVAIFPTRSNPPTYGKMLSLYHIIDNYDKIYVIVYDNPTLISTAKVVSMLKVVLCKFTDKFEVISSSTNFAKVTLLPDSIPKHDAILTTSKHVFANLAEKGYSNIILIPKAVGWDSTFNRIAFHRSLTYEQVKRDAQKLNMKL